MNTASVIAPAYIHSSIKRRKNTWYSIKDGNWSDPSGWMSNASKRYAYPGQNIAVPIFPQVGDDVYINHSVTVDVVALILNNVYVSGSLLFDATPRTFSVYGNLQAVGTVNLSTSSHSLMLFGVANYFNTFISGTSSTVTYSRAGDQSIAPASYSNLAVQGLGTKYATSTMILTGNLVANQGSIDILTYDLTVNGTTSVQSKFLKSGAGSLVFIGNLDCNSGTINLSGNPSVECRGGYNFTLANFTSGTGTWTFSTNNQNITNSFNTVQFNGPVVVSGTITITNFSSSNGNMQINSTLNGTVGGSSFVNRGSLYFNNTNTPMLTGTLDKDTFTTNVIGFVYNGSATLLYTTYQGLIILGTGIKTLAGNTTLGTSLDLSSSGNIECSTFNLTVGTTTTSTGGTFSKNGAGSILFTGLVNFNSGSLILSGNPTVEFRGAITLQGGVVITSGTGGWTFSTNNQNISIPFLSGSISNNLLLSGAITITYLSGSISTIIGNINGNNAASTFDCRGTLNYQSATQPMSTGILTTNSAANTFKYNLTGNQNVTGGTYRTIEFGGSGNKTLQGNVIINVTAGGSQSTTGTAVVVLNGFTITTI